MKLHYFEELVRLRINTITQIKKSTLHIHNPPWITDDFKKLKKNRQAAFTVVAGTTLFLSIIGIVLTASERYAVGNYILQR
jgi:hypothetical protein